MACPRRVCAAEDFHPHGPRRVLARCDCWTGVGSGCTCDQLKGQHGCKRQPAERGLLNLTRQAGAAQYIESRRTQSHTQPPAPIYGLKNKKAAGHWCGSTEGVQFLSAAGAMHTVWAYIAPCQHMHFHPVKLLPVPHACGNCCLSSLRLHPCLTIRVLHC
jgi:hypothetical protein